MGIAILGLLVIDINYWNSSIIYHSIFGIWFFYVYILLFNSYIKRIGVGLLFTLSWVKLLYNFN
jgi:hypothetical protein